MSDPTADPAAAPGGLAPQAPQPSSGESSDAAARLAAAHDVEAAARDRMDDTQIAADDAGATALAEAAAKR